MRKFFFLKLAVDGMKKNKQIYVPYLITCISTVAMFYILHNLSYSPLLDMIRGGGSTSFALALGKYVVAIFSVLFLWYTNSFLTKRRGKEFGLYNILGMGKRGLRKIMFWEAILVALIGLGGGLFVGVLFSKLSELCLANILGQEITTYAFTLEGKVFATTIEVYLCIFAFLLVRSIFRVQISNPMELFRSESYGEKPPKANWILAIIGLLLLVGAYILALSIQSPLAALYIFFIAVIMVIIATYFLFIAGSVVFCKLLKNNKGYYYKKQHFVSVSSMIYRMKRNGAGLASICILSTMVLVMLSSTGSMYFGMTDIVETRFFRQTEFGLYFYGKVQMLKEEGVERLTEGIHQVFDEKGVTPLNEISYIYLGTEGSLENGEIDTGVGYGEDISSLMSGSKYRLLFILSAEDYNRIMGESLNPQAGEAYLYANDCTYAESQLRIKDVSWRICGQLKKMFPIGEDTYNYLPSLTLVISDMEETQALLNQAERDNSYVMLKWYYGYDLDASDEEISQMAKTLRESLGRSEAFEFLRDENRGYSYFSTCKPDVMESLVDMYGGLFFIGILLSFLFLMAAVLIIYYKQISEGYEDQGRFEIMQKVGMTTKDIKGSINSQVLTVFFAPLLLAGVHLAFAYPLIWKVLKLLMVNNLTYVIFVTVVIYVAFTLFYVLVYKWTAGTYYRIVNGGRKTK